MDSIAKGVANDTVAPAIRERETQLARVELALRTPRPETPDLDALRAALEQRSKEWKKTLRAEPKVARMLLRRLTGPIEMWDESERPDFVRWETQTEVGGGHCQVDEKRA